MQVTDDGQRRRVTCARSSRALLLVHFLRDDLELTGTHWGCDTSQLRRLRRAGWTASR